MAGRTGHQTSLTPVQEKTSRQTTEQNLRKPAEVSTEAVAAEKVHKHPWMKRKALSEEYDKPMTLREGWWRTYIRETPLPGAYESATFLKEIEVRPNTYRFKSDGRMRDAHPHGKGATLLPGAYEFHHFLEGLEKSPATYNFKATDRSKQNFLVIGHKDKDINVSPDAYEIEKYLTLTTDRQTSKHYMFRSQSKRFPTRPFVPREGPGPGNYEYIVEKPKTAISSSFKSRTPRFSSSHTRVPGPGTYAKTYQNPMPETISKMGRKHGLFFSSEFQA